ncbi:hypothetical protein F7725_025862 [Dissostichus mawsoni]|uniref:Uncharacterized protein n=1 Tax=Dissostichus mawsoni TaxID=36200 RepID=A0A7J5X6A2_DISMA|nr:hypothetical protein F7725_025862 [Dissostichus mawsoni]
MIAEDQTIVRGSVPNVVDALMLMFAAYYLSVIPLNWELPWSSCRVRVEKRERKEGGHSLCPPSFLRAGPRNGPSEGGRGRGQGPNEGEATQPGVFFYVKTSDLESVNEARREKFCQKNRTMEHIPPTQDSLLQHLKRVAYQSGIWATSDLAQQRTPSPEDMDGLWIETAWSGFLCGAL